MSTIPVLFYLLGAATTVFAAALVVQPERASFQPGVGRRLAAAGLLLAPALVLLIFSGTGQQQPVEASALPAVAPVATNAPGMKEDADWAMITHAFMGGPPPGDAAAAGAAPAAAGSASQRAQQSAAELQAVTSREPKNVEAWLGLARAHRIAREFPEAATAYEAALKLDPRNADAWADYADALAASNGRSLVGKPAVAIDHALRLDPEHPKGLWLGASLELEQHHYAEALARWQKLRSVLPQGSPDIAVIDANIAEARQLTGQVQQAAR